MDDEHIQKIVDKMETCSDSVMRAELLTIHHAVMNPMEIKLNYAEDTFTLTMVKEFILMARKDTRFDKLMEALAQKKAL